jgi:two-component system sensor histidine kinase BaeS
MKESITHKLFFAMLAATFMAVVSMFLIMQWSIERGFIRYVNNIDEAIIKKLQTRLEEFYNENKNWDVFKKNQTLWFFFILSSFPENEAMTQKNEMIIKKMFNDNSFKDHDNDKKMPAPLPEFNFFDDLPHHNPPPPMQKPLEHPDNISNPGKKPPANNPPPPHRFLKRVFLLDIYKNKIIGPNELPDKITLYPICHENNTVGYIGLLPRQILSDTHQLRFIHEQKYALGLVGIVLILLAAGISHPLSKRITKPLKKMAEAAKKMTEGDYKTRVNLHTNDELNQLSDAFNSLAYTLEKNEKARQQWIADISHELRTPISVLRGEIEAIQDGIRKPDNDSITSLYGEVIRLGRLIEDLYQLSMSDLGALTYKKEDFDLLKQLNNIITLYKPEFDQKNIKITIKLPDNKKIVISADKERIHQLFSNILDNSLKYTEDNGEFIVAVSLSDQTLKIDFQDSSPGVPENDLDKLFERLYRVESSRNRETGGAGLGLAICKNIVEAHNGTISAHQSPIGGLWIKILLPAKE